MRVIINEENLDSLNNEELIQICMEDIIREIRGKNPEVKSEIYKQLTDGQKIAFAFKVMFDHSKTVEEFYWYALYLMSELNAWPEMKSKAQLFGDTKLVAIYERIEIALAESKRLETDGNWKVTLSVVITNDLVNGIFNEYSRVSEESIELIGDYIRQNLYEFIQGGIDQ